MIKKLVPSAVALALTALPLGAQQPSELGDQCGQVADDSARDVCYMVAQAVHSAQPQFGMLIANGNPTLGTAATGGLRLGAIPRVSATARVNAVFVRIPDILDEGGFARDVITAAGIPIPALSGDVSVGVFPGFTVTPLVTGIGAVDLIGSATWLPFSAIASEGFADENPNFAFGVGGRLGLLRESFLTPAASVSVVRHSLGRSQFGDICPGETVVEEGARLCAGGGDPGEFAFDLTNWSTRALVSKRLLGLGATLGVGWDRLSSDLDFGYREGAEAGARVHRFDRMNLNETRMSVFGNLSYTLLIGTLGIEGGWIEGGEPIEGFAGRESEFDPRRRSYFANLGLRIAL